jgi:proteic killer suppression protein
MIKSWVHKGVRDFYLTGKKSGIIVEHAERLKIILQALNAAINPGQLDLPGFRFHKLKGKLKDHYAITVRANWRIIFKFEGENVILVDYVDYH